MSSKRLRKLRGAWHAWSSFTQWDPFRRGYLAALEDASSDPALPEPTISKVERAFRRTYGIEER